METAKFEFRVAPQDLRRPMTAAPDPEVMKSIANDMEQMQFLQEQSQFVFSMLIVSMTWLKIAIPDMPLDTIMKKCEAAADVYSKEVSHQ